MDALFVMIEEHQLASLADLVVSMRPHGAPRWERGGVIAALRKVQHLSLGEVMVTAVAAAEDRDLRTPALIGDTASGLWRRATEQAVPATPYSLVSSRTVSAGQLCSTCSQPEERCRALWADDHEYLSNDALRAEVDAQDPMERAWRIAALKEMIVAFGKMPEDPPLEPVTLRGQSSEEARRRQESPHPYEADENLPDWCAWCLGPIGLPVHDRPALEDP